MKYARFALYVVASLVACNIIAGLVGCTLLLCGVPYTVAESVTGAVALVTFVRSL